MVFAIGCHIQMNFSVELEKAIVKMLIYLLA